MREYNYEGYRSLATAIIIQAVNDYERVVAIVRTEYDIDYMTEKQIRNLKYTKTDAERTKSECERFFYSDWYKVLTTIKADDIIDKIVSGIKNAKDIEEYRKGKHYVCKCGEKIKAGKENQHGGYGCPIVKCGNCGAYYRKFGKLI